MTIKILAGHVSPETAYVVDDYPYGYKLRCKIRYWLEYKAGRGVRFVSQTTNPKKVGEFWNAPKASTYSRFAACMFLDEENHVKFSGLHEYVDGAEATEWMAAYGAGIPEAARELARKWVAAKVAYDANRQKGDRLAVGLPEAHKAFNEA
jgi:hypothetical protein